MEVIVVLINSLLLLCVQFVASGGSIEEFDLTSSESDQELDPGRVLRIPPPPPPAELPWYTSVPSRPLHQSMFQKVFNLLLDEGLFFNSDLTRNSSPYEYETPDVRLSAINFTLGAAGADESSLLTYLQQILDASPHPSHPFFMSKTGAGLDPYALAGDWLATTMNSIPLNYRLSAVATLMEFAMGQKLRAVIGYPKGAGDGTPTAGPSLANIMAANVALQRKFPALKEKGFVGGRVPEFAIFLSQDACPSFDKAQFMMGFPAAALVRIPTDEKGRMRSSVLATELEKALKNGVVPAMVVGTAGTPLLGAIDPLAEIGSLCRKHGVWYHVDASWAGPALLSAKHSGRLKGIDKSDSVTWSWSGLMGSGHPSSFILTKTPGILQKTFGHGASYVFNQKSVFYNVSYDHGDSTLQTSRRPEVMKSWFLWKGKGQKGLAATIDLQYENLDFFVKEMRNKKRNGRFQSALPTYDSPTVVFNYVPEDVDARDVAQSYQYHLNKFTMELKDKLMSVGLLYMSIIRCQKNLTYAFAVSLANTALTKPDIKYLLDQIAFQAESLPLLSLQSSHPPVPPPAPATFPTFVSAPIPELHRQFYVDLFQLFLKQGLFFQNKRRDPAIRFREPEELTQLIDLTLGDEGLEHEELLKEFEAAIHYSPHYGHPYFVMQLMGG